MVSSLRIHGSERNLGGFAAPPQPAIESMQHRVVTNTDQGSRCYELRADSPAPPHIRTPAAQRGAVVVEWSYTELGRLYLAPVKPTQFRQSGE